VNYLKDRENDLISRKEVLGLINGLSLKYGGENSYSALMLLSVLESNVINLPAAYDVVDVVKKLEKDYKPKVLKPDTRSPEEVCSSCMVDLENDLVMRHITVVVEGLKDAKKQRSRRA